MHAVPFDELLTLLTTAPLSATDLVRLQEWIAGIAHPAECIALIALWLRSRPPLRPGQRPATIPLPWLRAQL
jgi:hypothetical protein